MEDRRAYIQQLLRETAARLREDEQARKRGQRIERYSAREIRINPLNKDGADDGAVIGEWRWIGTVDIATTIPIDSEVIDLLSGGTIDG